MTEGQQKQVPGVYKRRVGEAMVTTVNDGFLDIPFEILRGIPPGEMRGLMRDAFHEGAPRITVNAFVVQNEDRTILVDAGGGSTTVYSMGLLLDNLRTLGLAPADVDTVLLTHIHPDHSNGLVDADGKAVFPRAEIIVNEADVAFWSDPGLSGGQVPAATPYLASALALLKAYRDQIRPSRDGIVAPGLSMLSLPGHTPGHSGYRLESAGETLMIWGDTVHVPELQVPHPVVTSEFDIDEGQAAESRRRLFDLVSRERTLVAGMHLHVPAFAHLVKIGDGYRLVPEPWAVAL